MTDGADQGDGSRVRTAARPGPRRDGGIPDRVRHAESGADEDRALHAGDGSRPPYPRDGEGRARLRGAGLRGGERRRPAAGGEGARGGGRGGDRRGGRGPAGAAGGNRTGTSTGW